MTVDIALETFLSLNKNPAKRNEELKLAGISEECLKKLHNVDIRDQYAERYIAEVLVSYPSLALQLANMNVTHVFLSTIHGYSKPVIKNEGGKAIIYINN